MARIDPGAFATTTTMIGDDTKLLKTSGDGDLIAGFKETGIRIRVEGREG